MDLSVVIVSYNVSSFLDQTLATLADSARGFEHEVFVVDNASHDDSIDMVRRKHPSVRLIANPDNRGFAAANNQALRLASGRYILLLNPDTVLRRDTIRTMIEFLDAHPDAGGAGCKVINPDGTLQLACRRGFPTPGVAFFKLAGLSNMFPHSRTFGAYNLTYLDPDTVSEVDAISGCFMMLRKSTLDRIGFLDETFFMYGEDLDLCYRIKQNSEKIYYVPATEIIHFKGESTKTVSSIRSIRTFYSAMHLFVRKHHAGSFRFFPRSLLIAGIYLRMALGYSARGITAMKQPVADLFLVNLSLTLGLLFRFGMHPENYPPYSETQWVSIFIASSLLYMAAFVSTGMYGKFRDIPGRALLGVCLGFLCNILVVYFVKEYNFSRIASFYSWGFTSVLVTGWRIAETYPRSKPRLARAKRTLVVGNITDAAAFRRLLTESNPTRCEIIGCVETGTDAIRGTERDGVHILGLITELRDVIREYSAEMVVIIGPGVPFSRILTVGGHFGKVAPEFKFVPSLRPDPDTGAVMMIDIIVPAER